VPWRFSDACLLLYVATAVMQASVKPSQIQTPRAYVFGRVIKVIFDRADDVYVDVERKFAEALVRD
jgi:hypothetical protein